MVFRRMTAIFGKLQNQTLNLQDGFNIIEAPNETGKSTWCAFLLSMLYGINSRERDRAGSMADKNRYAPWHGGAMSGKLECQIDDQSITITRTTKRPSAPMGEFQAVYTNTAEPVLSLTAVSCGEQLLGVTRDVFARSAFIHQNQLGITQSPELERRITSLISSGEDRSSYSEAETALKKQLTRRQHNRTGQIPALEADLQQLRHQMTEFDTLSDQILQLRHQETLLTAQLSALEQEMTSFELWASSQQAQQLAEVSAAAESAQRKVADLRLQLEFDHIPQNEDIARLRGAIASLIPAQSSLAAAQKDQNDAALAILRAENAVKKSPFAGQTIEEARKTAITAPNVHLPKYYSLCVLFFGGAISAAIAAGCFHFFGTRIPWTPWAAFGIAFTITILSERLLHFKLLRKTQNAFLERHFGTANRADIQALEEAYETSLQELQSARSIYQQKTLAADTLNNNISDYKQAILAEIRRFVPHGSDLSTADSLLRGCSIRRKELENAEHLAREAALRKEILFQNTAVDSVQPPVPQPARPKTEVQKELAETSAALSKCRSAIQHLTGQLSTFGDASQLSAEAQTIAQALEQARSEYNALHLALDALSTANQHFQTRFAPALGSRITQLFAQLTHGRYQGAVLDRNFHLAAEPVGDLIYRDSAFLSAGTLDQLHLATRLAICETVLPAEKRVPLILDDALANFDDERCRTALQLLKDLSRHRQILLFTCHSREAAFFADDPEVSVHRLTNTPDLV